MKINSVNMKSFKKYSDETYNLTGLDMFIGKNGKGKSSVLQAINFAILGYIPGMPKTSEAIFSLSNNGTDMSSTLKLDTMDIGRNYIYNKKISEDILIAPLRAEKTLAEKQSRINLETGIEPLMLDFQEFLTMKDTEKKKYLYSLVGADWDKSKVIQYLDINIKNKTEAVKKVISDTLAEYKNNYSAEDGINAMLNYLENKRKFLNAELKKQNGGVQQLADLKNSLATTDRELENNKSQLNSLNNQLVDVEKKITENEGKNKNLIRIENQLKKFVNENLSLNNRYKSIQSQLQSNKPTTNNKNYGLELDKINSEIKSLEEIYAVLLDELKEIEKTGVGIKTRIESLQEMINSIESHKGHCAMDKNIKCTQSFIPYITEKKKQIYTLLQNKSKLGSEYTQKKGEVIATSARIKALQERRNALSHDLVEANKVNQLNQELNSIETQSKAINANMEDLKTEKQSIIVIDSEILLKQKNAIKSQINKIGFAIDEQNKAKISLNLLQKTILQREETEKEFDAIKTLQTHIGVKGLQGLIINEGLVPLQSKINENLKLIGINKQFFFKSEGKSFNFGLKDDKEIKFDALSTGEKLIVSLAIISAIIEKKNPNLKILLLDNIDCLDANNIPKVLNALVKLKSKFDNIIVSGVTGKLGNIKDFNIFDLDKEKPITLFDFTEDAI